MVEQQTVSHQKAMRSLYHKIILKSYSCEYWLLSQKYFNIIKEFTRVQKNVIR